MFHYIGRGEPDSKDTLLITAPSPPSKVNVLLSSLRIDVNLYKISQEYREYASPVLNQHHISVFNS